MACPNHKGLQPTCWVQKPAAVLAQGLAQDLTLVKVDRQTHSEQAEPYLRAGDWERKREEMLRFSVLSRLLQEPPKNFG